MLKLLDKHDGQINLVLMGVELSVCRKYKVSAILKIFLLWLSASSRECGFQSFGRLKKGILDIITVL
jgi:hypothetical protein